MQPIFRSKLKNRKKRRNNSPRSKKGLLNNKKVSDEMIFETVNIKIRLLKAVFRNRKWGKNSFTAVFLTLFCNKLVRDILSSIYNKN